MTPPPPVLWKIPTSALYRYAIFLDLSSRLDIYLCWDIKAESNRWLALPASRCCYSQVCSVGSRIT